MKEKLFFDNDIILDISIERDALLENDVNEAVKLIKEIQKMGKGKGA
jgi:hypothetical protein